MEKWLFLDDSGQLSNSGEHTHFLYGGIFIENKEAYNKLLARVKHLCSFFNISKEMKGSKLKLKHRRKILSSIQDIQGIHQVFLIEKNDLLDKVDFTNPEKLRLHKNYLVKRIVEKLHQSQLIDDHTTLYIRIDIEMLSTEKYRLDLEQHLNNYWKSPESYVKGRQFKTLIPKIHAKFDVQFLDSRHHRLIQLADLLVNTKYRRYRQVPKCCSEFLNPYFCITLPKYFSSHFVKKLLTTVKFYAII